MARFSEMVRNRGEYNGQQILDPKAYDEVFLRNYDVQIPDEHYPYGRNGFKYHNYWWQADDEDNVVTAWGVNGQMLYINPTDDVTIVKQSSRPNALNSPYTGMDMNAFTAIDKKLASASVPEPASWILLGGGLGLFGLSISMRRRRSMGASA